MEIHWWRRGAVRRELGPSPECWTWVARSWEKHQDKTKSRWAKEVHDNTRRCGPVSYDIAGAVVHWKDTCTAAIAVAFRAEFFAITWPTKELVVVFRRISRVQHLFAKSCRRWKVKRFSTLMSLTCIKKKQYLCKLTAGKAHFVKRFTEGYALFGEVNIFGAPRTNAGHFCCDSWLLPSNRNLKIYEHQPAIGILVICGRTNNEHTRQWRLKFQETSAVQ